MKKQKFFRGDLVQIADDLGASMRHFDKGCKAIVLGTYSELCNDNNNVDDYQLYILPNKGACSWYRTPQLTLIEPNRYDLLPKKNRTRLNWEAQQERDNNGVSLNSIQHPEGNPVPDDHEINPDSLETVEIDIPINERIKELARQAGFNDFPNDVNGVWITDGYWEEELERFAELVAEQTHTNNKAKWYQEGYEAGQRDERERIKQEERRNVEGRTE